MSWYQPRSFFTLVLLGFGFVLVPLVIGIANAARHLNHLSAQSQRVVYQAAQTTQGTWFLFQQVTAMERQARQFEVLGDPGFFQAYRESHRRFQATAQKLSEFEMDAEPRRQLQQLQRDEDAVYVGLLGAVPRTPTWRAASARFSFLTDSARAAIESGNHAIERDVDQLRRQARNTERTLFWQAFAVVPLAILFATVFTFLISRPIRQIDRAIRRLGDGDFRFPVHVAGPRDLQQLGARLEWLRSRLSELETDKKNFLRHVSHELKTPLSAIREGAELMREQVVGELNPTQREIAHIVHTNCHHLQKLIEDLLNFNLAETRNDAMRWDDVALNETIAAVVQQHKPAWLKKQITMELKLSYVRLRGDREKLATIVDNLLSNAIKFTPPHGRIELQLAASADHITLDVIDNGPGIEQRERPRVFEPFFQGQRQVQGHIKGTGLGLAIAKEYAYAHHGTLNVLEHERGAHLRLVLPRHSAEIRHAS